MSANTELAAFVSFPSEYTQQALLRAFAKHLPEARIVTEQPTDPVDIQFADYDLIEFGWLMQHSAHCIASSYCFRKALVRKNYLINTVSTYLAKYAHRTALSSTPAPPSPLVAAVPRSWAIELRYADDLDEAFMDDLYDLAQLMSEEREGEEERWFILKPAMADRGQGIRMFKDEEGLREIFEEFEEESSDEEGEDEEREGDEQERAATAVATSQLRHFVIQEYITHPLLLLLPSSDASSPPTPHKFHLRAYVLVVGSVKVYLFHRLLALFASTPYTSPSSDDDDAPDLTAHLTNTCLQGPDADRERFVRDIWELEGLEIAGRGGARLTRADLEGAFEKAGEVVGEAVRAGCESGSVHFQTLPNAFEVFGVDLLLSLPPSSASIADSLQVHLLEFNACPDFGQTGDRLAGVVDGVLEGAVTLGVRGLLRKEGGAEAEEWGWKAGENREGWRKCWEGEVRRGW